MRVLVGSTNPVKIAAVKTAFGKYFPDIQVKGIKTNSGVSPQPVGEETFRGAKTRALSLVKIQQADYYVGIEGGIHQLDNKWFAFGCMCVMDKKKRIAFGTSPWFELPSKISARLPRQLYSG